MLIQKKKDPRRVSLRAPSPNVAERIAQLESELDKLKADLSASNTEPESEV